MQQQHGNPMPMPNEAPVAPATDPYAAPQPVPAGQQSPYAQPPQYAPNNPDAPQAPYAQPPQNGQQTQYAQQPQYTQPQQYAQQPPVGQQSPYAPQPQYPQYGQQPYEQPKSNKQGLIAVLAIAVVALIGGAIALVLMRGGDDSSASDNIVAADGNVGAFSLAAAAQQAQASNSLAFTMTVNAGGENMTIDARMDLDTNLMAMDMDIAGESITAIYDDSSGKIYMKSPTFDGLVPTEWVGLDMSGLDQFGEQSPMTGNPLDVAPMFEDAENVTEIGMENINGRDMMHYEVSFSLDELMAEAPEYAEDVNGLLPEDLVFDVYVTEDNELGRMAFDLTDETGTPMEMVIDVESLDSIEPIVVPSPDQVTSLDEMMGEMTG